MRPRASQKMLASYFPEVNSLRTRRQGSGGGTHGTSLAQEKSQSFKALPFAYNLIISKGQAWLTVKSRQILMYPAAPNVATAEPVKDRSN